MILIPLKIPSTKRGWGGVRGGYWALFRFELSACYMQYFGVLGFFRFFFAKKVSLPWSNHILNTMGNPFFEAPFLDETLQFFLNSNYIALCVKTAFKIFFGPQEVPQPDNAWKWKCMFSSLGTFWGPKLFPKAVFTQSPIYLLLWKK